MGEGIAGSTLIVVRLDGVLRAVDLKDVKRYRDAGCNVEVYGVDRDLVDRFYRLKDVEESECEEIVAIHVRGHGSISLCCDHPVPVAGLRGLEEKHARDLRRGDFVFSFVKSGHLGEISERSSDLLLEERYGVMCSRRPEELAVTLWSLRLSGIPSTLAINRLCLKAHLSRRERDRVEKIPMLFFKELRRYLREATRYSDCCKHVYSHLRSRRAVSKRIALHALRDLSELVSSKEAGEDAAKILETSIKLTSSSLYVTEVSKVEVLRVGEGLRTYSLRVEGSAHVFLGLAPVLVA